MTLSEKRKITFICISLFLLFSLLIAHYFKIQVLDGRKWAAEALAQHETTVTDPVKRGAFYANNSLKRGHPEKPQPLVMDVTKFHLFIDPLSLPLPFKKEITQQVAALLQEEMRVDDKFESQFFRKSRSRKVAEWISQEKKEEILAWWQPFAKQNKIARNALYFVRDYQRSYPFGALLGQVLHTIRSAKHEKTNEAIPTGGLESYFDKFLKGTPGKRKMLRSPFHALEDPRLIVAPEAGADIYLTINHHIQAIAERELERGVLASEAKGGWAVMMDPYTGEILALAQYPFFDPSHYKEYFNDSEKLQLTKLKPITDAYELGSIMKPITAAICLQANLELERQGKPPLFHPEAKMETRRTIFPGRASKPLRDTQSHSYMNLYMAIQKSSNVYFAQLVDRLIALLGDEWYRRTLEETFGFGKKTGIELPAEATGFLPRPGRKYPNGSLQWSLPTPYSLAIGYNMLANSLQMLRAYAVFANRGYLVKPTLIRKIIKKDSEGNSQIVLDQTQLSEKRFPKVLEESTVREVIKAIKFTTKPGGTALLAEINGFSEGGKTGTAEKIEQGAYSSSKYVSSFIGFVPASLDPSIKTRFVLIVSIEEPKRVILETGGKNYHGGRCAGPPFQKIAQGTLEYLGETPDDPYGYPAADPRHNSEKADWLPESYALKTLYEEWNALKKTH